MVKTVGIIGYGHFGEFLHRLATKFFPYVEVKVYSRRYAIDNQTHFSFEEVCSCDVIFLCGAISEYEEQIKKVVAVSPPESIIVDVATVKMYTSQLMEKHCAGRSFLSTHPMFGPESYDKYDGEVSGFRIVVTDYSLKNDDYQTIKHAFTLLGFVVIEMTAEEHDQRLAETLFLTHYVSQSILTAGFTRTKIDTLSFQFLMDAVESVKDDTELFKDVYRFNPYCEEVAKRLHKAQDGVFKSLK